jgi:hypothetical protein
VYGAFRGYGENGLSNADKGMKLFYSIISSAYPFKSPGPAIQEKDS